MKIAIFIFIFFVCIGILSAGYYLYLEKQRIANLKWKYYGNLGDRTSLVDPTSNQAWFDGEHPVIFEDEYGKVYYDDVTLKKVYPDGTLGPDILISEHDDWFDEPQ